MVTIILKFVFLYENCFIFTHISLIFFHSSPINNNPALVQIMAWYRKVDRPLHVSEPIMFITGPRWIHRESANNDNLTYRCPGIDTGPFQRSIYSITPFFLDMIGQKNKFKLS